MTKPKLSPNSEIYAGEFAEALNSLMIRCGELTKDPSLMCYLLIMSACDLSNSYFKTQNEALAFILESVADAVYHIKQTQPKNGE